MAIASSGNDDYIKIFHELLLGWLRQGKLNTLLAQPPFESREGIEIQQLPEPLLKVPRGRRGSGHIHKWPRQKLHAKPNPFIACVLEGTADLFVGVTEAMAAEKATADLSGVYRLRMSAGSMVIFPPNVPLTDGTKGHWDGEGIEEARSTILWIDILPEGSIIHTCFTNGSSHTGGQVRFIFSARLAPQLDSLIGELQFGFRALDNEQLATEIVQSLMQVFLLSITRSLVEQPPQKADVELLVRLKGDHNELLESSNLKSGSSVVQRACDFIQARLTYPLTVQQIANQAFVSPAQLNRLFRAELNQSVMQYVSARRLQTAKSLLANTTLPVNAISDNVGVVSAVYFSHMFRQKTGMTPLQYRKRQRLD